MTMRRVVTVVVLGLVMWSGAVPFTAHFSNRASAAAYEPMVQGWERYFSITWEPFERHGVHYVGGYVDNTFGLPARRIQLLVDGLDASGNVVSQKVSWLGSDLTPGTHAYFETRDPEPGKTYRVRVFAFDRIQTASLELP